jgi:uncharacterized protein YdeI (YjbR/CyaY-like superfamily)
MPEDVGEKLMERQLLADYEDRPFYQRNDYLAWIGRAKRPATRAKRIEQMLSELDLGGVYMGMDHPPSRKA